MRPIFLAWSVALLMVATVGAMPVLFDDEDARDEMDPESDPDIPKPYDFKTFANMNEIREKLKLLSNAETKRVVHQNQNSPSLNLHMNPARTNLNRARQVFASVEKINERFADYLYQSDILLTVEQINALLEANSLQDVDELEESSSSESARENKRSRKKRKAISDISQKWPTTRPIPYYLDADLTPEKKQVIDAAVHFWQSQTCLSFRRADELEDGADMIRFINGFGCSSSIGRVGGNQLLSIDNGCEYIGFGIMTHELGHALGFYHEQSRYDRDSFVKIDYILMDPSKTNNFDKPSAALINTYGIPYEYGSIMHYASNSFANNSNTNVIVAKNELFQQTMGQRTAPSFFDVYQVNRHYECLDKCTAATTDCHHGGYPNPKNCTRCICPSGFGGDLCIDVQTLKNTNCGQKLTAAEHWQLLEATVGEHFESRPSHNIPATWEPVICSWHLTVPTGSNIEVRVVEISALCYSGCFANALQIKTSIDFRLTGMRICCRDDNRNYVYRSEGNTSIIIAEAYYRMAFKLEYRLARTPFPQPTTMLPSTDSTQLAASEPDSWSFESGDVYSWKKWRIFKSSDSLVIWSDVCALHLWDTSSGWFDFLIDCKLRRLYSHDNVVNSTWSFIVRKDLLLARKSVSRKWPQYSVFSAAAPGQKILAGHWIFECIEDGNLIITNIIYEDEKVIIGEELPGFIFVSSINTSHEFTAEKTLGPEFATGWTTGRQMEADSCSL